MAIPVGIRRRRVKRKFLVKLVPIRKKGSKKSKRILVDVKSTGKPFNKSKSTKVTDQRKGSIEDAPWNAVKVKGSYVYDIKKVKYPKSQQKKLSLAQRRARRRKKYAALEKKLKSKNPAKLKNISTRVGEYSAVTGKRLI